MRAPSFLSDHLRDLLLRITIATLPELKQALGTSVDITVFRKLKELSYLTSYSHRGRFYTLDYIPRFDSNGLWSFRSVWFSRHGTLVETLAALVQESRQGYFADELQQILHVEVKDALLQLVRQRRLARQEVAGIYLYGSSDSPTRRRQVLLRQQMPDLPVSGANSVSGAPKVSGEELKASIVLFSSSLNEKQRRLYAGLESIKYGRGGDRRLAAFLQLDPHTVARGRKELLAQEVDSERVRKPGGGRKQTEKKRPR